MEKRYTVTGAVLLLCASSYAQMSVVTGITPAQVVSGFMGPGLTISNIQLNCAPPAYGTFSNGNSTNIGISHGSIFTSGSAAGAAGPNNMANFSMAHGTQFADPNLGQIEPLAVNDPCILTFDVIPTCTTLTIQFVFGSEEYPEWVGAGYNDAFGFFITGPNPSGPAYNGLNIARLANGTPVSIDNINANTNAGWFVANTAGPTIQYDGFTKVITSNLAVVPCSTYHFKIAIADAGDDIYDSGVFIQQLFCSTALSVNANSVSGCGCSSTASVTVSGGQPPYSYLWSNGQTAATATGLCPGTYTVTVNDVYGCAANSNSTTVTITSLPSGTAATSYTPSLCTGGTATAMATVNGGAPPYTYVWSNGQTAATATGLVTGNYTVTVTDANGCWFIDTINVFQPVSGFSVAVASTANAVCAGGSTGAAMVSAGGGTLPYMYAWTPNVSATSSASGLAAGNYTVIATDALGCADTTLLSIGEPPPLVASASGADSICKHDQAVLMAAAGGGTPGYTYLWNPGNLLGPSAPVTPLSTVTYTLAVTDAHGCTAPFQYVPVLVHPLPVANFGVTPLWPIAGNPVQFNNTSNGAVSWFWMFSDGHNSSLQHPMYSFPGPGTYTVTQVATSPFGCKDTFTDVWDVPEFMIIPNVFTPDGDGTNDEFYIPNSGMEEFHLEIFDRWGLKVYETSSDEIRWDGRSTSGTLCTDGTYYVVLHAILKTSKGLKNRSATGYVTLLTGKR